jgi:DNA-binding response OmpR family regulator
MQGNSLRPSPTSQTDILVIDDDELFGLSLVDRLKNERWSIAFHHGPFGTVNAIRAAHPKLLILDLNMPGLEGTRIHDLLRKQKGLSEMKVLLLSSTDSDELNRIANENGFDGALNKGATRAELVSAIHGLIG